jgi:ubiquinone/menaquinone biosynthesis C-methylase UbiE
MGKNRHRGSSERAENYFEFVAQLGMTKHYGSMDATRELIELCHISSGHLVLEVGCGVGATPCYLAKAVGCRVVGVDLVRKMIDQSQDRARNEGVTDQVAFGVADARRLPFEANVFDAVIAESVNVFFDDKHQAVREYLRVTRPGGYVGMTEMTWLKPPRPEVRDLFKRLVFAEALDADAWTELLEQAPLTEVAGASHAIDMRRESGGRFERYGRWPILRAMLRMLVIYFRDRRSRQMMKGAMKGLSRDLFEVVGYGVYAGRKPERRSLDGTTASSSQECVASAAT